MKPERQSIVEITKYSKKGLGQGILPDIQKVIEVRGAHVGEKVLVKLLKNKKGIHQGEIIELLEKHPLRVVPRCSHADVCGGCSLQSLSYQGQVAYKNKKIKELFQGLVEEKNIHEIVAMEDPWAFRNKMEYTFYESREGEKALGLIMAGTKGRVFDLQECHLPRQWMVDVLKAARQWWEGTEIQAYHRLRHTGVLHTLTLREGINTEEKMVILTVCGEPSSALGYKELEMFKKAVIEAADGLTSLFLQIKHIKEGEPTSFNEMVLYGKDHIQERLGITASDGSVKEFLFKISPSSFFQPNTKQAEKLFSLALQMVTKKPSMKVLDLYCGTGTLGMLFSSVAEKVFGIELNPYAVFDAEVNLEVNGINNMKVMQGDVNKTLKTVEGFFSVDLAIIDPPRAGLGIKTVVDLVFFKPEEILYISCNPDTQLEDVKEIIKHGYEISLIQPVDQFAHGPHLENIVLLRKKS